MKGDPALQTELEREYISGKRPKTRACVVRAAKKKKKGERKTKKKQKQKKRV
jgi:hypothetical protein